MIHSLVLRRCMDTLAILRAGWESYMGSSLCPKVRDAALELFRRMEWELLPMPAIGLSEGGSLIFGWANGGRQLEVEVLFDGCLAVFRRWEDGRTDETLILGNRWNRARRLAVWLQEESGGEAQGISGAAPRIAG